MWAMKWRKLASVVSQKFQYAQMKIKSRTFNKVLLNMRFDER